MSEDATRAEIIPFDPWAGARVLLSARERLALAPAERPPARWYMLTAEERALLGGLAQHIVVKHRADEDQFGFVATTPYLTARLYEALRAAHGDESVYPSHELIRGGHGHDLTCYRVEDAARRKEFSQLNATLYTLPLRDSGLLDELVTALCARIDQQLERHSKVQSPAARPGAA